MSFFIKSLAFLDICTAIVVIIFQVCGCKIRLTNNKLNFFGLQQIATLARFVKDPDTGPLEKVAVGIWGGISFLITGIVFWRSASRQKLARV